ncbi:hypothetical protein HZ326_5824 [Fusarium oxysporum f. sp. albedinis]|nr:hypothetical protein HZ326_5824 [Fusarium oxysporum f. sp. albedinis]
MNIDEAGSKNRMWATYGIESRPVFAQVPWPAVAGIQKSLGNLSFQVWRRASSSRETWSLALCQSGYYSPIRECVTQTNKVNMPFSTRRGCLMPATAISLTPASSSVAHRNLMIRANH